MEQVIRPFQTSDEWYTYAFADIDLISRELGIPWEPEKDQLFALWTIYISFLWDLEKKTVRISDTKAEKYL